uniref:BTB domain-containing protein n=1 Tax=Rhodnius prolixus TaxID=13249 RepID=T1HN09_RHOPR
MEKCSEHASSSKEEQIADTEKKKEIELSKAKIRVAINKLNSSSSKEVLKALSYIRFKVTVKNNDVRLLQECGGFKYLFKALSSPDNDVLNATLSILGNCTQLVLDDDICKEIRKSDVATKLLSVLRKTSDVKVQKRLCRLIGNLAQSKTVAQDLNRVAWPAALILLLDNTEDVDVQHMAIRALRWMWASEKFHSDLLKVGTVKAVSSFLDTENEQLVKLVLRSLIVFTQPCTNEIALQLVGKKGNGYEMIVSKLGVAPMASVLICNLSQCPFARIELSKAGIVAAIIQTLNKNDEDNKLDSYLITSLCYVCQESMIRASLRYRENGFKTMLSLLMNPSAKHFYPELLCAITQFNYDEPSLMQMVKGGLVNVLLTQLKAHTKEHGSEHTERVAPRERTQGAVPAQPLSPPSQYQFSPPRSMSPPDSPPALSDDMDTAGLLFSPRFDPSDSEDYVQLTPSSSTSMARLSVSFICSLMYIITAYSNPPSMKTSLEGGVTSVDSCILETLCQLTYQRTPIKALGSRTTVDTLLEYMVSLRYPQYRQNFVKATKTLSSIVTCKHYFNNLLEEECVLAIDRLLCRPRHPDCWECSRLRDTGRYILQELAGSAQSGLGEGEMTYRLASSSQTPLSITTALSVPHVIKQPNMLNSLLFGHRALRCLLDTLNTRLEEAVPSLHNLFTTLAVKNPQVPEPVCTSCEVSSVRHETNVTFVTDDGFRVGANRQSLEHSCPVFEAMFRGGFMESNLSQVHLSEITADCLQYLTRLTTSGEFCSCLLPNDINTLLEMVHQTDRFLLPNLTKRVLYHVMNNRLSPDTSPQIYRWGMATGRHLPSAAHVPRDVVKYLLSAIDISATSRTAAVGEIVLSEQKDAFLNEITQVVKENLATYSKNYRSYPITSWSS